MAAPAAGFRRKGEKDDLTTSPKVLQRDFTISIACESIKSRYLLVNEAIVLAYETLYNFEYQ